MESCGRETRGASLLCPLPVSSRALASHFFSGATVSPKMLMHYVSDYELLRWAGFRALRSSVARALAAFRRDFSECYDSVDVLVMGPEGGWHECSSQSGARITIEAASALVEARLRELLG